MKDFARFVFIVLGISLGSLLVWFLLYSYGQSKPPSSYQTELIQSLKQRTPIAIDQSIPWTAKKQSSDFLAIEIFFEQQQWQVRALPSPLPLTDFLKQHPNKILFTQLRLNQTSNASSLRKIVNTQENWKRLIFASDSDGTLKDLRELDPRWTFATGKVFFTRFLSLASLRLHSLLKIPGDVLYITDLNLSEDSLRRVVTEARKQGKFVLLGPSKTKRSFPGVDGWVLVKD